MESNYNIKRNGYVQPHDTRQEVVQAICDHIIDVLDDGHDYFFEMRTHHPELFLYIRNDVPCDYKHEKMYILGHKDSSCLRLYDCYRVHSCEMRKVFSLLQNAGYHIYYDKDYVKYTISVRPYLFLNRAERTEFKIFID